MKEKGNVPFIDKKMQGPFPQLPIEAEPSPSSTLLPSKEKKSDVWWLDLNDFDSFWLSYFLLSVWRAEFWSELSCALAFCRDSYFPVIVLEKKSQWIWEVCLHFLFWFAFIYRATIPKRQWCVFSKGSCSFLKRSSVTVGKTRESVSRAPKCFHSW